MWPTFYLPAYLRDAAIRVVEVTQLGCYDDTVTFTPSSQTPSARAGDLFVLIVHSDFQVGGAGLCTCSPDTFKRFIFPSQNVNHSRAYAPTPTGVLYKVLTEADLTTTFTLVHTDGTAANNSNELCVRGYVFRSFDPDIPLDCFSYLAQETRVGLGQRNAGCIGASVSNVPGDYQFSMAAYAPTTGSSGDARPASMTLYSPPLDDNWHSSLSRQGVGRVYHIDVGLRKTTDTPVNLIPGETFSSPLANWTHNGMVSSAMNWYDRLLKSNNSTNKHYSEISVSLTAGTKYSWHTVLRRATGSQDYTGLTVVPPTAANEFGAVYYNIPGTTSAQIGGVLDPLSDRGTNWEVTAAGLKGMGTPSEHPVPHTVYFTAAETGTYKLRIWVGSNSTIAGLTHTTLNLATAVGATALFEGYNAPLWVPSADTAPWNRLQPGPVYFCTGGSTPFGENDGSSGWSFVVNQSGSSVVPAVMMPQAGPAFTRGNLNAAGTQITGLVPGSGSGNGFMSSRPVYPEINGVKQKYYVEFDIGTVASGGSPVWRQYLSVGPVHGNFYDNMNTTASGNHVYMWERTGGRFSGPTTEPASTGNWPITSGDKYGIMVDYVNAQVTFYRNGVAAGTFAMYSTSPAQHDRVPFIFMIHQSDYVTANYFNVTVNMRGPFTYKPSGALPWDWKNEIV